MQKINKLLKSWRDGNNKLLKSWQYGNNKLLKSWKQSKYRTPYYFWQWQLINYWDDCHLDGINSKAKFCHGNELPERL